MNRGEWRSSWRWSRLHTVLRISHLWALSPKLGICTKDWREHCGKRTEGTELLEDRERTVKCYLWPIHGHCIHSGGDVCPGSALVWVLRQSDKDEGGSLGASPFTAELFAIDRSRERGSHCLQLWTQWWPQQASVDNSNQTLTQMALIWTKWVTKQTRKSPTLEADWQGGGRSLTRVWER